MFSRQAGKHKDYTPDLEPGSAAIQSVCDEECWVGLSGSLLGGSGASRGHITASVMVRASLLSRPLKGPVATVRMKGRGLGPLNC